jgi:Family of unknown function (DUF6479)
MSNTFSTRFTSSSQTSVGTSLPSLGPTETGGDTTKGPSKGAIAGIVVAAVLVVIAIVGLVFWVLRRRHQARPPANHDEPHVPELAVNPVDDGKRGFTHELPGNARGQPTELAATDEKVVSELDSTPARTPAANVFGIPETQRPDNLATEQPGSSVLPRDEAAVLEASPTSTREVASPNVSDFHDDTPEPRYAAFPFDGAGAELGQSSWAVCPQEEDVSELVERQKRLKERRERLLELEKIDQEEDDIRKRLSQATGKRNP